MVPFEEDVAADNFVPQPAAAYACARGEKPVSHQEAAARVVPFNNRGRARGIESVGKGGARHLRTSDADA